jgi:RNA polymerase sigma factor (sigma-70 family)
MLIGQMKAGNEDALSRLHHRYWPMLVAVARARLSHGIRRGADEEDVAQEAFWSFFRTWKNGQIPRLENRRDLLALLTHIVACRAVNQIKREIGTVKRGAGRVMGESVFDNADASWHGIDHVSEDAVSPEEQAALNDCYQFYLNRLPESLRGLAEMHLAGMTNKEMAERLGCVERTVERKLALLRQRWRELAAESISLSHERPIWSPARLSGN